MKEVVIYTPAEKAIYGLFDQYPILSVIVVYGCIAAFGIVVTYAAVSWIRDHFRR